jgi:ribosomal protein S21
VLEVKRKDGESFESMMRRFSKKTVMSGRVIQAKKIQFVSKPLNKRARKNKALRRQAINSQREFLIKVGKLDERERFNPKTLLKK